MRFTKNKTITFSIILTILCFIFFKIILKKEDPHIILKNIRKKIAQIKNQLKNRVLDKMIKEMSIDEKIGQILMVGWNGNQITRNIKKMITQKKMGNIILLGRNYKSLKQLQNLNNNLQKLALKNKFKIPLLISTDQEGGTICHFKKNFTLFSGNMALGAINSKDLTYKVGLAIGNELKAVGVNLNLAPVLDILQNNKNNVIGTRSFSNNFKTVAALGLSFYLGQQKAGIISLAKHFPGHGSTINDSHKTLPINMKDIKQIKEVDIKPFKALINNNIPIIMTAHVAYPKITGSHIPATLSSAINTKLLRKELKFKGILITDDLEMKGVTNKKRKIEKTVVLAFNAGCDILLVSHSYAYQLRAIKALKKAIKNKIISIQKLNKSVRRILTLKMNYFTIPMKKNILRVAHKLKIINSKKHLHLQDKISQKSTSIFFNKQNTLPLNRQKSYLVLSSSSLLYKEIKKKVKNTVGVKIPYHPSIHKTKSFIKKIKHFTTRYKNIIIAYSDFNHHLIIDYFLKKRKKVILCSLGTPFSPKKYLNVKAIINSFHHDKNHIKNIVNLLIYGKN